MAGKVCELCDAPLPRGQRRYCSPECVRQAKLASQRRWYKKNPEVARARSRQWYIDNPEKAKAQRVETAERRRATARAWHQANPRRSAVKAWAVNVRMRGAPADAAARERVAVLLDEPCSYCGGPGGQVDHIVPISAGGASTVDNLAAACASCNQAKGTKSLEEFLTARSVDCPQCSPESPATIEDPPLTAALR